MCGRTASACPSRKQIAFVLLSLLPSALGINLRPSRVSGSIQLHHGQGGVDVSVSDFRTEGELSTAAFKQALAAVEAAGGGTVRVPAGNYVLGPLELPSNLLLWLEHGAVLNADVDESRLPMLPALASYGPAKLLGDVRRVKGDFRDAIPRYKPLLHGRNVQNVTIGGENGTIDGQGAVWWARWQKEALYGRPHLIQFENSSDIRLTNVTLRNAGYWAAHVVFCDRVTVQFLSVLVTGWPQSGVYPVNTDGLNPDSSTNVLIEDSYFQTGDDSIAIKSGYDCFGRQAGRPSRNITIRRVTFNQVQGCNAAGVAIGSEMSGGVEDVLIEDCVFQNVGVAVEVKTGKYRGGYVRGVVARNLVVRNSNRAALTVMAVYPERSPFCHDAHPPAPVIRDITYEDIFVEGPTHGRFVHLEGVPEVLLDNVTVRRVRATRPDAAGKGWHCRDALGVASRDNSPLTCPELFGFPPQHSESEKTELAKLGTMSHLGVEGHQCYGDELKRYGPVESALQCYTLCRQTPKCAYWTWNSGTNKHCYTKFDCSDLRDSAQYTSGSLASVR